MKQPSLSSPPPHGGEDTAKIHNFRLTTSDPEHFQERIAPLSGFCKVRPAKGASFDIAVRATKLEKLNLFVVKAPSIKLLISPPHSYFCLNIPLDNPFRAIASNQALHFSQDVHLLTPDQQMNLEAASGCRVLAVKLNSEQVFDTAFKLSGCQRTFQSVGRNRLTHSTMTCIGLLQVIANLWSKLQRKGAALAPSIDIAESVDALFTNFVLAAQEETKRPRSVEPEDKAAVVRAEEYLRSRLTEPVSRAELAAAAGVSIRTLSRGFAERWGTGPMGFLKARRMEAAYRELLGSPPEATSVTAVALRYGFNHFGKFAVEYKRAFRESPSMTLRH